MSGRVFMTSSVHEKPKKQAHLQEVSLFFILSLEVDKEQRRESLQVLRQRKLQLAGAQVVLSVFVRFLFFGHVFTSSTSRLKSNTS